MRQLRHPLSRAVYEWADDGVGPVKVTDRDGWSGRFDRDGGWVAGALRFADPQMCRWVAGGGPTAGGAGARSRRFSTEESGP